MQKQIKFKKYLKIKRIIFLLMLAITFYIIFNFSSQEGQESSSVSIKVTEIVVEIISKVKNMDIALKLHYIDKLHPIIRKLAHFSMYTVVGFCTMGFMCTFDMRNILKLMISFSIGIIYAVADEAHQYFIPDRNASIIDVCIDSVGVLTGIFILIILIIFVESIVNWLKR